MSDAFVTAASSIDIIEREDGSVVLHERPLFPLPAGLTFLVAGAGLLWWTLAIRGSLLVRVAQEFTGELGLACAVLGFGAVAFDFGWSELHVGREAVELSRRILWFRLRKKLPLPVDISSPSKGLEIAHRSRRYRFARNLNSLDSSRLVNFLLTKFPALERAA